jgi:hypothetical protein
MRTKNSGRGLARDRYVGKPKSTRVVPPPVKKVAGQRTTRSWAAQNARLVARGGVTLWVDIDSFVGRTGAGQGRPYSEAAVRLCVVVMALYHLPLRQADGFTRMLLRTLGHTEQSPDYSTICRRRVSLKWDPPALRKGQAIVINATGVTVRDTGPWLREKHGDNRRARFVKLHAATYCGTGEFLAVEVTPAGGRGSGDVSVGPRLIRQAALVCHDPPGILADRAYDAESCYDAAGEVGSRLVTPPKDNAARGLHPVRDTHLHQIGRLGPPTWKRRIGYGRLTVGSGAQVESSFGALKKMFSDRTRAQSFVGARAEILAWVYLTNQTIASHPLR